MADAAISRSCDHGAVLADYGRARLRALVRAGVVAAAVLVSAWYVNLLDIATLANGVPAIFTLARELFRQTSAMRLIGGNRWLTR